MRSNLKIFNRWLAAFGVAAFLMVAGWHVGADGTVEVFTDTEVALENAVGGSMDCNPGHYSTGVQSWCDRWSLCCDESTNATCCFS